MWRLCNRVKFLSFSFGFIRFDYLNIDVSNILLGIINIQLDSFIYVSNLH